MGRITLFLAATLSITAPTALHAQDNPTWTLSSRSDLQAGTSTVLGSAPYELELQNGWGCVVAPLSNRAREVSCSSGGRTAQISVDCNPPRSADRVQLRLSAGDRGVDFVDLACSTRTSYRLVRTSTANSALRIPVATFDAAESADYNRGNCEIARDLFAGQGGVRVEYWCEPL